MLSEKYAKVIRSLIHKKYRYQYNLFVAEGSKSVVDILASGFNGVDRIYCTRQALQDHKEILTPWIDKIHTVSPQEIAKISNLESAPDMLMTGQIPKPYSINDSGFIKGIHLYLDQIQDPGNLGTILRTAEWFGVQSIGLSEGCADVMHPKVIQASMGSFCRIRYWIGELNLYSRLTDWPILGADLKGIDLFQFALPDYGILVIGNEGQGISSKIKSILTQSIKIPGYNAITESLNAAVASAIILAEWQRQIHTK